MLQRAYLETEAKEKFISLRQDQRYCMNFSIILKVRTLFIVLFAFMSY